ncbi:MAG: acyltransferase family protein [Bryobacteraceae bacterium]
MNRYPFLDWMRGLAVVIMIQCHTFNSFARLDVRQSGPYVLSQFIGGMAAPLFLFMAGMTFGFQMESLERREPSPWRRFLVSMKRAGYIMAIAFAFRLSNWIASLPRPDWQEIFKVDILNSMALGMAAFAGIAALGPRDRLRWSLAGALVVASLAPVVGNLDWNGVPQLVQDYLAPGETRGRFPFFPYASYIGFGLAAGAIVKRTSADGLDRLMQWYAIGGFALIFSAQYFANIPSTIYPAVDFWRNSPSLIFIRVGVTLAMLAGAYLWTVYLAAPRWSWMQAFGKTSLLVYWVHIMLVYGNIVKRLKRTMPIPETVLAVCIVIALMVALAAARLAWKDRAARKTKAKGIPAYEPRSPAGALAPRSN